MEEITRHYLISGRVQGVGFRAFTKHAARSLNLKGWVRNLSDGRVEVLVSGPVNEVKALEDELKCGPQYSQVDSMVISERTHEALNLPFEQK